MASSRSATATGCRVGGPASSCAVGRSATIDGPVSRRVFWLGASSAISCPTPDGALVGGMPSRTARFAGLMAPFAKPKPRERSSRHARKSCAEHRQRRAGGDLPRRSRGRAAEGLAELVFRERGDELAVGDFRDQCDRLVCTRLSRDVVQGASTGIDVSSSAVDYRLLRDIHHVLHDAAGDPRAARPRSLRARCWIRANQHPRWLSGDLDRDGTRASRAGGSMSAWVWVGVALLSGIAAIGRFLLVALISSRLKGVFPLGTFVVNTTGALLLGLLAGLAVEGDTLILIGAATLGSYTTFSTWMLETHRLPAGEEQRPTAAINILLSLIVGVGAVALGRVIGVHL